MSSINNSTSHPNVLSLIDFCKGLAIVLVFLFHYSKTWFGWQGVHIFIVLSGFGLTYSCLNKQNISWKHWYIKRAERILPVYWLVSLFGFLFLTCINLRQDNLAINFVESLGRLILDLSLLRNFYYKTIFNYPNDQLWFVPLIVGMYMIFPWLYKLIIKHRTIKNYLIILIGAITTEFIYRATSIYLLDGAPVGFQTPLWGLPLQIEPLNLIPNNFLFPFQLHAPFGQFPARIAEFTLGMIGAVLFVENKHIFNKIFSNSMLVLGIVIWLAGYTLVYVGLWGWIFASFLIALGIILWTINLAWFCQQKFSLLFLNFSHLGKWSYYIFLTHSVFIHIFEFQVFNNVETSFLSNLPVFLLIKIWIFGCIVFATAIASWLVMQFDKSKLPKLITQRSIAQVIK